MAHSSKNYTILFIIHLMEKLWYIISIKNSSLTDKISGHAGTTLDFPIHSLSP